MPSKLQKLQAKHRALTLEIHAITHGKLVREAKKLVGRHFKYRNCYSCPEKPSDYWFLYSKVISVDDDGQLTVFQFATDKYGKIEINPAYTSHPMLFNARNNYVPIVPAEFCRELRKLTIRINSLSNSVSK